MAWLKALPGMGREGIALWSIAGVCALLLAFNLSGVSAGKVEEAHGAHMRGLLLAGDRGHEFGRPTAVSIASAIAANSDPAGALSRFIAAGHAAGAAEQRRLGEAARLAVRMAEAQGELGLAIQMSEAWIAGAPLLSQEAFQDGSLMTASAGKARSSWIAGTELSAAAQKLPERKVLILYLSNVALLAVLVLAAGMALMQRRRARTGAA